MKWDRTCWIVGAACGLTPDDGHHNGMMTDCGTPVKQRGSIYSSSSIFTMSNFIANVQHPHEKTYS